MKTWALWPFGSGLLILGLTGGLADSVFYFLYNHGNGCYQFPFLSFIGCQSVQFSWELVYVFVGISILLIAVGLWYVKD